MNTVWIALITAFLIDLIFGDPPNRFHPVVSMGNLIHWTDGLFNRGQNSKRFFAGTGLIIIGGALFSLPWMLFARLWPLMPGWVSGILLGICLKPMFAFRGLLKAGREVQTALKNDNLMEARRLVAWHLVSRDTRNLSREQVASATIESLAENLTDSFFAPLFYFVLGGLPLAWFYRFVNTADAMIAYRTENYEYFGKFTAHLDDVLNWLPARLASFALVLSAAICRLDPRNAWAVLIQQHTRTSSPNAGWTMAAAAGGLGVVLEKSGVYRLEGGSDLPDVEDISKALRLVTVALLISLILCGGIALGIAFLVGRSWGA